MRGSSILLMFLCGTVVGCGGDSADETTAAACDPSSAACTITHDFEAYDIAAGSEYNGLCMSWTLENETELWVNSVSTQNDGSFHHSNWFYVPTSVFAEPDGYWDCAERGFDEVAATAFGGVLYAQSTQVQAEEQRFREGAAIRIPPFARIIASAHLLNVSGTDMNTQMRVSLDTVPADEVDAEMMPLRLNYFDLQIAPMATSTFGADCDLATPYEAALEKPFEMKLHWVLPHFHYLGDAFSLKILGGERDGEVLFELDTGYGDPLGHRFEEPIDLGASGARGVSFSCGYTNTTSEEVGFGVGNQEMCVMLGFTESNMLYDANVPVTEVLTTDPISGTGACQVLGVPR